MCHGLNESPSEKEGKLGYAELGAAVPCASMKVPPKRKGNAVDEVTEPADLFASMKVPPKRKGNSKTNTPKTVAAKPQ